VIRGTTGKTRSWSAVAAVGAPLLRRAWPRRRHAGHAQQKEENSGWRDEVRASPQARRARRARSRPRRATRRSSWDGGCSRHRPRSHTWSPPGSVALEGAQLRVGPAILRECEQPDRGPSQLEWFEARVRRGGSRGETEARARQPKTPASWKKPNIVAAKLRFQLCRISRSDRPRVDDGSPHGGRDGARAACSTPATIAASSQRRGIQPGALAA